MKIEAGVDTDLVVPAREALTPWALFKISRSASPCATLESVTLFLETKLKTPEIKHFKLSLT